MTMKNTIYKIAIVMMMSIGLTVGLTACDDDSDSGGGGGDPSYSPSTIAFPEAKGCGTDVTGGRGGSVYVVTTLEDKDPVTEKAVTGSLRWALEKTGSRIVVFAVSGTIHLRDRLSIPANTTILGQTAPGDGICLAGDQLTTFGDNYLVRVNGDNVIIQFLRCRLGNTSFDADAFNCIGHNNVMIDHCSFSWSTDECATTYENRNFTMQWCMVYEGLNTDMKGNHGFGGIWGGSDVTFHHNLIANQSNRYPRFDHEYAGGAYYGPLDFVNNVVYITNNCNGTYGGESCNTTGSYRKINMVNNYYRYLASVSSGKYRILNPVMSCSNCSNHCSGSIRYGHFYVNGNYVDGSPDNTADNWNGVSPLVDEIKSTTAFPMSVEMTKQSATEAYASVLAKVGASLSRDAADTKVINNVINNNGGTISTVPTFPELSGTAPLDTDCDGLPDEWEDAHGLDKNNLLDSRNISPSGYAYIEDYAQSLVSHLY